MNPEAITWLRTAAGVAWSHREHKRIQFQTAVFADVKEDAVSCKYPNSNNYSTHETCIDGYGRTRVKPDMYCSLSCVCFGCLGIDRNF